MAIRIVSKRLTSDLFNKFKWPTVPNSSPESSWLGQRLCWLKIATVHVSLLLTNNKRPEILNINETKALAR